MGGLLQGGRLRGGEMKRIIFGLLLLLIGCNDADVASHNISKAADNFQIHRRIVFYNGITNEYILVVEGRCSLGNYDADGELSVTCKDDTGAFVKHFLGLSDNVTYFAEQLLPAEASTSRYRVVLKPTAIIPDIEIR